MNYVNYMDKPIDPRSAVGELHGTVVVPAFQKVMIEIERRCKRLSKRGSEEAKDMNEMLDVWESTFKHCEELMSERFGQAES
jgi:hypothetical protein